MALCSYQRFQYILIRLYILFWKKTILLLLLLQAFSTQEILKHNINDCIKINGKQRIIMPKKAEYIKFYNFEEKKIKSAFIIYVDFESIVVTKIIERKIQKSAINKYEKHIPCIYWYKNAKMEKCFRLKDMFDFEIL